MQIPTELNVNLKDMASIKDSTTQRGSWELNNLIKNLSKLSTVSKVKWLKCRLILAKI